VSKDKERTEITILHQDEHILVVSKPVGVLVIPDREGRGGMLRTLRQKLELSSGQELRVVHRIDRGTSGLVLIARHIIDQRIAKSGQAGRFRIDPMGKRAITRWRVSQRFGQYCLLECRPVTGRTHQIRVHLQSIGLPLAVDPVYGGAEALYLSQFKPRYKPSSRKPESPLISRLTLHAYSLRFKHPATQEEMQVEAPLPADFARALKQLQKYGMK
jgi:23S rRNA-/tRNA-specific pseudouridylate synthase